MKTLIVIPAYNEELTIGSVVALARKYGDVLVVDDGSGDRTSEIAREAGAIVIRHGTMVVIINAENQLNGALRVVA
ncbi:hypothetical protein JCM16138_02170 [Thermococcus atlanticus]